MPNFFKGNASNKGDNSEILLADMIHCEGGQIDSQDQSAGENDERPKLMSLMNRVANTLDISSLCEKLEEFFV